MTDHALSGGPTLREPAIVTVIPESLLERMAKAGYEEIAKRKKDLIHSGVPTWDRQTQELREEYLALARAMHQSLGDRRSSLMATASRDGKGKHRSVILLMACAVVLVLLGGAGAALWAAGWGGLPSVPGVERASPAMSEKTPIGPDAHWPGAEPVAASGAGPEVTAPTHEVPEKGSVGLPSPSHNEAGNRDLAAPAAERREPRNATCTVDLEPWPADGTDQAKAIQILLRDLGFYGGTTYGTVGPATRAAIRKFQLAGNEAETGEPSKMLFESLRKKKCASAAP